MRLVIGLLIAAFVLGALVGAGSLWWAALVVAAAIIAWAAIDRKVSGRKQQVRP